MKKIGNMLCLGILQLVAFSPNVYASQAPGSSVVSELTCPQFSANELSQASKEASMNDGKVTKDNKSWQMRVLGGIARLDAIYIQEVKFYRTMDVPKKPGDQTQGTVKACAYTVSGKNVQTGVGTSVNFVLVPLTSTPVR